MDDPNVLQPIIEESYSAAGPVLQPEHPLLEKFQNAVKEQLLLNIESLKNEILEYDFGCKKEEQRREVVGVDTYNYQQVIEKQKFDIEKTGEKIKKAVAATEILDTEIEDAEVLLKKNRERLMENERQEINLRRETEIMNYLIQQMSTWETEVESNIQMNKRMSEKSKKQTIQLSKEKLFNDAVVFRLTKQVWQLENEIKISERYEEVKEEDREDMAKKIASGNASIDIHAVENHSILKTWEHVVAEIGDRDRTLNCLKNHLKEVLHELQNILTEIEQTKKLTYKQMIENEKLFEEKDRLKYHMETCESQVVYKKRKNACIERNLSHKQSIVDQIERDLEKVTQENIQITASTKIVERKLAALCLIKHRLDEELYEKVRSKMLEKTAATSLIKQLKQIKEKNNTLATSMTQAENKNSIIQNETMNLKFEIGHYSNILEEYYEQMKRVEEELKKLDEESKKQISKEKQKHHSLEAVTQKYAIAMEKYGAKGNTSSSETQTKVWTLQKDTEAYEESNKAVKRFWLIQQKNQLALARQRQQQIQDLNLLKKQVLILEQKNLKMNDEVSMHKKIEENMLKNVRELQSKIAILCDNLCKKRGMINILNRGNDIKEQEYISRLEDAEIDCLRIGAQLEELEEEKVNLSTHLIELNREGLEWEKKYMLMRETCKKMRQEGEIDGELRDLKNHNQREKLKFRKLQKAMDHLVKDLQSTVYRREIILMSSTAKISKKTGNADRMRVMFYQKLKDVQNQIKQIDSEIKIIEQHCKDLEDAHKTIEEIQASKDESSEDLLKQITKTEMEIREAETKRMMNFDILIQKQKKLAMYSDLAKDLKPFTTYRTPSLLQIDYTKQKDLNASFCIILTNLVSDFPEHTYEFNRLLNCLRVPELFYE